MHCFNFEYRGVLVYYSKMIYYAKNISCFNIFRSISCDWYNSQYLNRKSNAGLCLWYCWFWQSDISYPANAFSYLCQSDVWSSIDESCKRIFDGHGNSAVTHSTSLNYCRGLAFVKSASNWDCCTIIDSKKLCCFSDRPIGRLEILYKLIADVTCDFSVRSPYSCTGAYGVVYGMDAFTGWRMIKFWWALSLLFQWTIHQWGFYQMLKLNKIKGLPLEFFYCDSWHAPCVRNLNSAYANLNGRIYEFEVKKG